jgi:hypothetical protein
MNEVPTYPDTDQSMLPGDTPPIKVDLALALRLLDQLTDINPCPPLPTLVSVVVGGQATAKRIPLGPVWHVHDVWTPIGPDEECPTAQAKALLARYGIRVTVPTDVED